jgi:hypothetical protein
MSSKSTQRRALKDKLLQITQGSSPGWVNITTPRHKLLLTNGEYYILQTFHMKDEFVLINKSETVRRSFRTVEEAIASAEER